MGRDGFLFGDYSGACEYANSRQVTSECGGVIVVGEGGSSDFAIATGDGKSICMSQVVIDGTLTEV